MKRTTGKEQQRPWRLPFGLEILYEDDDIMVVFKPEGLLSVAAGGEKNRTAYWILNEYLRRRGQKRQIAVVHRLDRDTSGVMVFAKSAVMKKVLMDRWDDLVAARRYVAVVEGSVTEAEGTIDLPLTEDSRARVVIAPPGKGLRAVTRWKLLRSGSRYSMLALELETGRRNQIRVHCAAIGHPVVGDSKYGSRSDPLGRLGLHAETLAFHHPRTGAPLEFSVPPPPSFTSPKLYRY
ncbi:RluA family pseudouridine synthase [Gracilinema caldarium]|uniref:Pseudouridine synthase n=1 Tax=Gracilinema caldarium (strain ATCC 51460 / DSM 7334 / H1) TaxID=744872 RepID=F8EZP1_GRAC1|nr:RluA family pseudouridine synthase [Gracilinema caldarium]AEJ20765.1 pseudouridine synthase [Gracilinema caldarium DSM 7334]